MTRTLRVRSESGDYQVLEALKRYVMFVADNGIEWGMSSTADDRVPAMHEELRRVKGADFEVVVAPPGYVAPK